MKQFVTEQHHEQALESLSELIRIPSVLDEADSGQGHPFGKKVIEALDKVLAITVIQRLALEMNYSVSCVIWTLFQQGTKIIGKQNHSIQL